MLATLTNIGDFAKFTQSDPFHYVTKLVTWKEETTGAGTLKREFRWSTTNLVRASWMDLTEGNLQKIVLDPNNDLYVDFRYTLIGGGPISIEDIYVEYEQSEDASDKFLGYRPPMLVSEKGNISNLFKIENFTFKPYEVNPAIVLYKELSYTINKMFGHQVQYARSVPMAIGKDFTLHEWTLYDVDDPCPVKVLVPNNEFPDSKINFNPMGLDFEMPFEVHIVKNYFEEVFGIGTAPQKRDIIYFPLTNRIYEIDSSYLWKDIMQREVYWKVSLKKYQPKANRYETKDLREQFDVLTWNSEERFGEEVRQDEQKITKPEQYDPKIGSRDYDPVRLEVNDDLFIAQSNLKNYNLTLSESQYDLRSIFAVTNNPTAVSYRATVEFTQATDQERSLCGWFKPIKPKVSLTRDNIKGQIQKGSAGLTETPITFILPVKRNFIAGQTLKISRFNGLTLFGSFVSSTPYTGGHLITMNVRNDVITFIDTYYPGWSSPSTASGYVLEPTYPTILMDGYDKEASKGWKVSIVAGRYVNFVSSTEDYLFILPNTLIEESWYAFFMNINNFYQQISFDLWVRKWSETDSSPQQTTQLENIYSNTIIAAPVDRSATTGYHYTLPASNTVYTNIRLFNKTETDLEKQIIILNQTIVQDTQFAIIIDNAVPRLTLPWVAKTK
jgi:hypothetical protein